MKNKFTTLQKISLPLLFALTIGAVPFIYAHGTPAYAADQLGDPAPTGSTFQQLTPDWEKTIRKPQYGFDAEISTYANGRVYYKLKEQIAAAEVTSGKTKWTVPVTMAAPPVADTTALYVINKQNLLYKLDQKTGKVLWKSTIPHPETKKNPVPVNVLVQGNLVITSDSHTLSAFDRVSGKLKWQDSKTSNAGYRVEQSGNTVILAMPDRPNWQRGNPFYAYDSRTGRLLWKTAARYNKAITVQDGYVYSQKYKTEETPGYTVNIDKIDLQTGKVVQTFGYLIDKEAWSGWGASVDYYDGDFYVIRTISYEDRQWGLFRIPLGTLSGSKPVASYSFYTPIYQVNCSGNVLAVALMDEHVYFLNRQNGQQLGVSIFESNFFNTTLDAETHFLIQTAGKISAVRIPEIPLDDKKSKK
ncbi:outer membrane protein assembly factor BamB family protein [Paenibacillus shenyangensis]|uniref:outer membrane protein assembly factor BamB family protein n=1 Tax=Paenibacillus sp. A9 TaxID=1284352 RepID=UPI000379D634|nr:PQQ-binding-like beta-propeller repeat protein [Paenibacillus sp. A9]